MRLHIRVTKDGNGFKYELMNDQEKIGEVSFTDIIEMIMQFTSSLRWR